MKSVLVLGNLGYVGPVLVRALRRCDGVKVVGFDCGFFQDCMTAEIHPIDDVIEQRIGDVRDICKEDLKGFDAVIYLAAVSNDPMGVEFENPTYEINTRAALHVAELAKACGTRRFVFASSCSVYGLGDDNPRSEGDPLEPLTAYARSKISAEHDLQELADDDFVVSCLRFATACGPSPRLRLDLVLNDFVATAISTGRIEILSDGTPMRPLIDTRDMADALVWAAKRSSEDGGPFLVMNVGSDDWNFSVFEIANKVSAALGDVEILVNDEATPDPRSYRVDFSRFRRLAPSVYPTRTIDQTIGGLRSMMGEVGEFLPDFRKGPLIRLNVLRQLRASGLGADLRWPPPPEEVPIERAAEA